MKGSIFFALMAITGAVFCAIGLLKGATMVIGIPLLFVNLYLAADHISKAIQRYKEGT